MWVYNLLLGFIENETRHNNFWDNIEPLKYVYVTSNGQTSRTKVYRVSVKTFYLILNLFETINEKEAIYSGENFGGQNNNITSQHQEYFHDLRKIMRYFLLLFKCVNRVWVSCGEGHKLSKRIIFHLFCNATQHILSCCIVL